MMTHAKPYNVRQARGEMSADLGGQPLRKNKKRIDYGGKSITVCVYTYCDRIFRNTP